MLTFTGLRSWLLMLTGVVLLGGALPAAASAEGFGELSRFGSKGVGQGQFTEHGAAAVAFGVDATSNSVYVGDEPEEHLFRIQKFSASGVFLGAATLKTKGGAESESGIEGVAIDSVDHRFYVLVVQTRSSSKEIDPEVPVAGALYAFSTVPNGEGVLEPASGTGEGGLLAGSAVFKPQSETPSQVLLEPSGIAVDPTPPHDVIVMGREDREGAGQEPAYRVALERITSGGALGARWVDKASSAFFEEGGSEQATSPVVTSEGKVYVIGGALETIGGLREEIVEIPKSFGAAELPATFIAFDAGPEELATFPGEPQPLEGAGLSVSPEGTLWAFAKILNKPEGGSQGFKEPGALAFNANGSELGWTGGQSAGLGSEHCVISPHHTMVAAGGEQKLFVFDSSPEAPRVIEFGPGGSGCLTGKASALAVTVAGHTVEPGGVIAPGAEAKISTAISEANAKEVKWSFGDGASETTTNQHQLVEAAHKFVGEGEFKVKATIKTDNLATPEIVEERTVTVSKPLPIAKFTALSEVKTGEADKFDAGKSTGSEGSAISEYHWSFGDGSSTTTTSSTTSHSYATAGIYTVTLTVTDAHSLTSKPVSVSVTVKAPPPPPPPTTSTTTTTPPPPPPGKEVLAYKAVFAGSALTVAKTGAFTIKVDCAAQSSCTGSVTLRTLTAVSAAKHKKAILTLASGAFALTGGQMKVLTLHLSAKGRALLAHVHTLRVSATIVARDSAGVTHTTQSVMVLHAAKSKKH